MSFLSELPDDLLNEILSFLDPLTIHLSVAHSCKFFYDGIRAGHLHCVKNITLRPFRIPFLTESQDRPSTMTTTAINERHLVDRSAPQSHDGYDIEVAPAFLRPLKYGQFSEGLLRFFGRLNGRFLTSAHLSCLPFDSCRIRSDYFDSRIRSARLASYMRKQTFLDVHVRLFMGLGRRMTRLVLEGIVISSTRILVQALREMNSLRFVAFRECWIKREPGKGFRPPRSSSGYGWNRQSSSRYTGAPKNASKLVSDFDEGGLASQVNLGRMYHLELRLVWFEKGDFDQFSRPYRQCVPAVSFLLGCFDFDAGHALDELVIGGTVSSKKVLVNSVRKLCLYDIDQLPLLPRTLSTLEYLTLVHPEEVLAGSLFSAEMLCRNLPSLRTLKVMDDYRERIGSPALASLFRDHGVQHLSLEKVVLSSPEVNDSLLAKIGQKCPRLKVAVFSNFSRMVGDDKGEDELSEAGTLRFLKLRRDSLHSLKMPCCLAVCTRAFLAAVISLKREGAVIQKLEVWGHVLVNREVGRLISRSRAENLKITVHGLRRRVTDEGLDTIVAPDADGGGLCRWQCCLCGFRGREASWISASVASNAHLYECPNHYIMCTQCRDFFHPNCLQDHIEKVCKPSAADTFWGEGFVWECPFQDCGFQVQCEEGEIANGQALQHMLKCRQNVVRCPCCVEDVFVPFRELDAHLESEECDRRNGILWEVMPRKERQYSFCTRTTPLRRLEEVLESSAKLGNILKAKTRPSLQFMTDFVSRRALMWNRRLAGEEMQLVPPREEIDEWRKETLAHTGFSGINVQLKQGPAPRMEGKWDQEYRRRPPSLEEEVPLVNLQVSDSSSDWEDVEDDW